MSEAERKVERPATSTPARRPRSARRTSTVDILRPLGLDDPRLLLRAAARGLVMDADGHVHVADEASLAAEVRYGTS